MAAIKSYTDIEQSKKLAEILPLESADMYIDCTNPYYIHTELKHIEHFDSEHYPCWSLAVLLNIINNNYYTSLYHDGVAWNIEVTHHDNVKDKHSVYAGTPIDACVAMIERLHELKML